MVRAGVEEALASGNITAKVQAVRILSDLEVYGREGDGCYRCAQSGMEVARLLLEHEYKQVAGDRAELEFARKEFARNLTTLEELATAMVDASDTLTVQIVTYGTRNPADGRDL